MREGETAKEIIHVIMRSNRCPLEEVISRCPNLTWNQVFLEVDRLSRSGHLRLTMTAPGVYAVELAQPTSAIAS